MGKVTVGASIAQSFRYIGEGWRGAWGAMLLLVWLTAATQIIRVLKPEWALMGVVGPILTAAASTMAVGALYRLRFSQDHAGDGAYAVGPAGFQWGGLEWRVLGANILVGLIVGVILVVLLIVWAIGMGVAAVGNPELAQALQSGDQSEKTAAVMRLMIGPGGIISAIILIPSIVGLVYLSARLSLVTTLAADTGRFDFGRAWSLTKGVTGAIVVAMLVFYLAVVLAGALVGFVIGIGATLGGHADAARQWGGAIGETLGSAVSAPLFAGLALYVYRSQRGDPNIAATFA
jgi:hypothetical protein